MTRLSRFHLTLLAIWFLTSLLLIAANAQVIGAWRFPDPDDQLRLLQVRDWLGGQSWFDVTQYRMNAPNGAPMHWSRWVDLPVALVIVTMTPLLGADMAESIALVIVPLVTMGAVMFLVARLTAQLLSNEHAILAALLVPICVEVTAQLRPMRIDHHGWQMALAMLVLGALIDPRIRRGGIIVGAGLGLWLGISLEGLPFAVATMALMGLRWTFDRKQGARLTGATLALATVSTVLFTVTHTVSGWQSTFCDAMSPVHLTVFWVAAAGSALIVRMSPKTLWMRIAALGALALAAAGLLAGIAPACAADPFAQLDPLVYNFWYLAIMEGLPIWKQSIGIAANTIALPLIGIIGALVSIMRTTGEVRANWAVILFMLVASTLTAVMVQRAGGVANLVALAPAVALVMRAVKVARAQTNPLSRMALTLAVVPIAAPGLTFGFITTQILYPATTIAALPQKNAATCGQNDEISRLSALPTGAILAPLDISPAIILLTPHKVVASSHHRNQAAMHDVIAVFLGTADEAQAIITKRAIDYIIVCPGLPETGLYKDHAPTGFWAQLERGTIPAWLTPVAVPGAVQIKVWRVTPAGTSKTG